MKKRRLDQETIELLADEPELLAIADAIAVTQPIPARRVRRSLRSARVLLVAAILGATAVVAAVLALVLAGGGESPLVRQALAAVRRGPVFHVVLSQRAPDQLVVDLRNRRARPVEVEISSWYDARTGSLRTLMRRDGTVAWEIDSRGAAPGVPPPVPGAALAGFARAYVTGLEGGAVRARRVGGARMIELPAVGISVGLARATGLPTRVILDGTSWRVATASATHETAAFKAPIPTPWKLQTQTSGGFVLAPPGQARPVVVARRSLQLPSVTAEIHLKVPPRLGDAVLTHAWRERVSAGGSTSVGFHLEYQSLRGDRGEVLLARSPIQAYGFFARRTADLNPIPTAPRMTLTRENASPPRWRGQLVIHGLYTTVRGYSRAFVIAGARALARN